MAKIVWAFDITMVPNTTSDESIESGYEGGFLICPKEFPVFFTPRSKRHTALIDEDMERVQSLLDTFKN
jgi:hypothetical protein